MGETAHGADLITSRQGVSGVLVIDKPRGQTSHVIVVRVRRTLRTREVGHAGTLDPMATGVLVVALGQATKLVPWLTAHDKSYRTTIALGIQTDSLDADGREDLRVTPGRPLLDALSSDLGWTSAPILADAIERERARTSQIPPAYSAIKVGGQRAFDRARRGQAFDLAPRPVRVARMDYVACTNEPPTLTLELDVAKGYYVRSLARDLSAALGTVGHLIALCRTRSGPFSATEALSLDTQTQPEELLRHVIPLAAAAKRALPSVRLTGDGATHARTGRAVVASEFETPMPAGVCGWLDVDGSLVAVGEIDAGGSGRVVRGFAREPATPDGTPS